MSRVVYVGGFGSGRSSANRVAEALSAHFEEVDPFTFSDYIREPGAVKRAAKGAGLVTHSAGALALQGLNPESAYLFCPPLPRKAAGLVVRSLVKQVRMYTPGLGVHRPADLAAASRFSSSSAAELVAHPKANLGQLPAIADFDAIKTATAARYWQGTRSTIIWTRQDAYFLPSLGDLERADRQQIPCAVLDGEHDEVVLRPEAFLSRAFNHEAL